MTLAGTTPIITPQNGVTGTTTVQPAAFGMPMAGTKSIVNGLKIFAGNTTVVSSLLPALRAYS